MNITKLKSKIVLNKWFTIKLIVLLFYIVLVITYFFWGIDDVYLWLAEKPVQENEELAMQIESSKEELANIPRILPALIVEQEYQLEQAQEILAYEQRKIPTELNINDLVRDVIKIANDCQIKAIPLSTAPLALKPVGQYSYNYWLIFISIEGDFQNITNFVENIGGKYISTGSVTNITLDRTVNPSDSSDIQNQTAAMSGSLELIIYTKT